MCVCVPVSSGETAQRLFVPALVAAGQTGLPAAEEAVFGALLLAAGGRLDWR